MNRLVLVGAIAGVASGILLAACSGTPAVCSASPTALTTKFGSCDAGFAFTVNQCTNQSACTTAYNACTTADQNILNAHLNCINNQPTCSPGGEAAWFATLASCNGDAGTPSAACTSGFPVFDAGGC